LSHNHEPRQRSVVLSLHPRWVEAVSVGEKTFEYRRRVPRQGAPYQVVLYASTPECALVATAVVSEVIALPPAELAERTSHGAAHESREALLRYFAGCKVGYALRLRDFRPLSHRLALGELRELGFSPPQSFAYLDTFPALEAALNRTDPVAFCG
jgi:predicted transcriptional regulator